MRSGALDRSPSTGGTNAAELIRRIATMRQESWNDSSPAGSPGAPRTSAVLMRSSSSFKYVRMESSSYPLLLQSIQKNFGV
jgi:hypothetical protein